MVGVPTIKVLRREVEFRPLRIGDPLVFSSESCLTARRPDSTCNLCREVCPLGILSYSGSSIALENEGCISCGLCTAACPTGALMVEGCMPSTLPAAADEIVIECRRVAAGDRDPNAVVVPCLGGLTTPDLLDVFQQTQARVVLADHGWCGDCAVARCMSPWQATLDESKAALAALDAQLADELVVRGDELPLSRAEPVMTRLRPDELIGRREFLRRFMPAAQPRDGAHESRGQAVGRGVVTPVKRERILERIGALASELKQDFPAALMPAIKITDGCDLNGLCAAICPTGALRRDLDDDAISLQFDAARCITCNLCQGACPSNALRLWPQGDGNVPDGPVTLVKRRVATCVSCGDSFIPAGDECSCRLCEKTMNVMREVASLKFGLPVSG